MTDIAPLDSSPVFTKKSTTAKVSVAISGAPDTRGKYHSKAIRPRIAELTFEERGDKSWNRRARVRIRLTGPQVRKDGSESKSETTFSGRECDVLPWMLDMVEMARPSTHPKTDDEEIG
ncbi:hypothetical protein SEA_ARTI_6 [Gordonia phage Arti]|nr:hypothetical protein SEA_GROOTJR_8 [Gordonia phage GrootJr]WNM66046.1 hypothetical protein SEA_WHEEZY_6 [Gordonia phage Wheezy]WNM69265.1 hypothetical protein SEA_ARTI_6 [Gordonia phage Arti]